MLRLRIMGSSGWMSKAVCGACIAALATGCGVVTFFPNPDIDTGVPNSPDLGVPDVGMPDAGLGEPDVGPLPDAGECRERTIPPQTDLPQEWPFASTEDGWKASVFSWAERTGTPQASQTCTLAPCHGGTAPGASNPPFMGNDSSFYQQGIAAFWPLLRDQSAYDNSSGTFSGSLWKHHEQFAGDRGDASVFAFSDEDTQFLKDLVRRAWACRALPEIQSQDAGPDCGPGGGGGEPVDDAGAEVDGGAVDAGEGGGGPVNLCYCPIPPDILSIDTSLCE